MVFNGGHLDFQDGGHSYKINIDTNRFFDLKNVGLATNIAE